MRPERSSRRGGEGVPSEKYMETQVQEQVPVSLVPGSVSTWRAPRFPAGAARRRSSRVWECLLPAPNSHGTATSPLLSKRIFPRDQAS